MIAVQLRRAPPIARRRRCRSCAPAPGAKYLGGGTNLVDLMRETIERPAALVDVDRPVDGDRGAATTAASASARPCSNTARRRATGAVRDALSRCWPARSSPALARRSATWRRSAAICCSARAAPISTTMTDRAATSARPGQGCDAIEGFNRIHAILGASPPASRRTRRTCASRWRRSTPSCISRAAAARARSPLTDLHRLPGERPEIETVLEPGELITAIELPPLPFAAQLDLSQGPRPGELRVRAGLGRGRARGEGRHASRMCGSRSAASRTSRGGR